MKYFLIFFILFIKADIVFGNRILLSNVEKIRFYNESLNTEYKITPMPKIINLDNHYDNVIPRTLTCRNLGGLGNDIQYECSTVLNDNYNFSYQNVNCEGYNYNGYPYKLECSCSLEYRLKIKDEFNGGNNSGIDYGSIKCGGNNSDYDLYKQDWYFYFEYGARELVNPKNFLNIAIIFLMFRFPREAIIFINCIFMKIGFGLINDAVLL